MAPRRKRAAVDFIDLTGDAPEPARKRPTASSSQPSRTSSGANHGSQRSRGLPASTSTQEPEYLDLTQEDDAFDKEFYGTFGWFYPNEPSILVIVLSLGVV